MQVQVLFPAPNQHNPNPFPIGDGFGLLLFFDRYESAYFRNGVQRKPTSKPRGARKKKQIFAEQKVTDAVFTVCRLFAFLLVLCLLPHLFTTHFPFANSSLPSSLSDKPGSLTILRQRSMSLLCREETGARVRNRCDGHGRRFARVRPRRA
jgi:hypothetical protein